jgi:two-component system response regulator AtoC
MKENLFRCDLYHRLNEIPITLPPLCDRREDIPGMVKHFLSEFGFEVDQNGSSEVFGRFTMILSRQDWPGNVRELLAQIKYYYVTCGDDLVRMTDLALGNGSRSEKDHLLEVLEMTGWNRSKAASMLGVSEGTIRNRIKKYRLSKFVS